MRHVKTDPKLEALEKRVLFHARNMGRTLPEMRFFILDPMEFTSLLEKGVYPRSPVNMWEGKRIKNKKHRIESGAETSLYYEVVQTGNPSYAYLNETNSAMMQASVMAHVVGHCEFSELNVLHDSDFDRTEYILHLTRKLEHARVQMGKKSYINYWNAIESGVPLMAPNSMHNCARTIETEQSLSSKKDQKKPQVEGKKPLQPYSYTVNQMLQPVSHREVILSQARKKQTHETLSRRGYKIKAPCQDVFGFLYNFAPTSQSEKRILEYHYKVHEHQDFVIRTQIMNEGWAMYWEKKIMTELFKERAVNGIIEYAKSFSGVCYPRPFFMRNPYHLGFHLWNHIEEQFKKGRISLDFLEENDRETKNSWNKPPERDAMAYMEQLIRSMTDYEFIRRFLTHELVDRFHLNRIPTSMFGQMGIENNYIIRTDEQYVWVLPELVKQQMLQFFTHYHRPRIYVIDSDFKDGGLLLFHRNDSKKLRKEWLKPTLKNINTIWKGGVYLYSRGNLYTYTGERYSESQIGTYRFDLIEERLADGRKPISM